MKTFKAAIIVMSILSFFGCKAKPAPVVTFPQDTIIAKDGSEITLTFYGHASIAVGWDRHNIYFDPVGKDIDWANQPKADLVLITHDHYDHYDADAVKKLNGTGEFVKMVPGENAQPFENVLVEAVPAYNISKNQLRFHPKERCDAGYILTVGGTRIYVAGDTEDNEDVLALKNIDIAFLPCNQPYTMKVEQCAHVVETIRPAIFYPYHFGGTDTPTDMKALEDAVKGITDFRLRPME